MKFGGGRGRAGGGGGRDRRQGAGTGGRRRGQEAGVGYTLDVSWVVDFWVLGLTEREGKH